MGSVKKNDSKVVACQGDPQVTPDSARELGLAEQDLERLKRDLGKTPTYTELRIAATMWSERCAQRSSRAHLKRLSISGAHVTHGTTDGAGALDLEDGLSVVLRLSSERMGEQPAEAAERQLSQSLRDVVAMGAKPVALLDTLKLGAIDAARTKDVLRGAVDGLSRYGRELGLGMVGGDTQIDSRANAGSYVGALALGVCRSDALMAARNSGLGNKVLYLGQGTSADGTCDATVAAALAKVCSRLFASGYVDGAEALGAGGLCAAAMRLATRAGTGIELDLDAVPHGASALSPADMLCLETPERLLVIAHRGREEQVLSLCNEAGVAAHVVGIVTNTQRFACKTSEGGKPQLIAELPLSVMTTDAPRHERPLKAPEIDPSLPELPTGRALDVERELLRLVGSPRAGSREWIFKQLEPAAKASAVTRPGQADAAVLRVGLGDDDSERVLAVSVDASVRHVELDPRQGAAMLVAECARNVACTGGEPLGLVACLTLSEVDSSETAWRLSQMIDGLNDASTALKLPVVGCHVSVNEGHDAAGPCSLTVGVVGRVRSRNEQLAIAFGRQADTVAVLGGIGKGNLSGSEWAVSRSNKISGTPLSIDLAAEVKLQRAVLELGRDGLLSSAHDVSDGGLGVALAECCIAGRIGCSLELETESEQRSLELLFHEEPSRIVVSFAPEQREKVQQRCEALGVPFTRLGFVGGDTLEIEDVLDVPVHVLVDTHARALEPVVGD